MPGEARFAELRRLLTTDGWRLDRVNGSHHVFVKPGQPNLVIPVHRGKVKPFYVRQVKKIIEGA